MKSGPGLPQLEKALAQKRRPNTAISKLKKKNSISKIGKDFWKECLEYPGIVYSDNVSSQEQGRHLSCSLLYLHIHPDAQFIEWVSEWVCVSQEKIIDMVVIQKCHRDSPLMLSRVGI